MTTHGNGMGGKPSKPNHTKPIKKTMKMGTKNDKNRVGIYTQVSAEATAAGEGFAPQGEKSPVAKTEKNGNLNENNNKNTNQSQCSDSVNQSEANKNQDNADSSQSAEEYDPFQRKEGSMSGAGSHHSGEWDNRNDRISRNSKYRLRRLEIMRNELKKLGYSNKAIRAMEVALEDERKRRHHSNKMARYCRQKNLDEATAKQQMLERKEREIAKYKAEKAAREEARKQNRRSRPDWSRDRVERPRSERSNNRDEYPRQNYVHNVRQNPVRQQDSRFFTFTSPAILSGANPSMKRIESKYDPQPGPSGMSIDRGRPQTWRGKYRNQLHLSPPSSDSSDPDTAEQSLSAFSITNNLNKLTKRERKKLAKGKLPPSLDPNILKYPIEVQIVNRAHPLGAIIDDDQLLLLKGLQNSIQEERDNGAHCVKIGECVYKKKILHIRCRNEETVCCLQQKMPFFNRLLLGSGLYLSREKVSFSYKRVRASFNNFHLTTEEFLKIIKKQNGYPTEVWQEFNRKDEGFNTSILLGVDSLSYERLERENGMVYFFMGRIMLNLTKK